MAFFEHAIHVVEISKRGAPAMGHSEETPLWQPVNDTERCTALDVIRGLALLGVLLVNLHVNFRISLPEHLLGFDNQTWQDWATDVFIRAVFEFKAFALFSVLFGAGLVIFAERAARRGASPIRFLVRRLLVLLAIGLVHLLLVWNGDILTLYAVCGLLLIPLYRLPAAALLLAGAAAFAVPYVVAWGMEWPTEETLQGLAAEAAWAYSAGGLGDVVTFHWRETRLLILPLLVAVLPRTWSMMAIGAAAWKFGVLRNPADHRVFVWGIVIVGGGIGSSATLLSMFAAGEHCGLPPALIDAGSSAPLALAYGAGALFILRSASVARLAAPLAAVGQIALTNYLTQSLVLSFLFYGYGLGLYGRLGALSAAGVGLALYASQVVLSYVWLKRHRFGPVEWVWRSLTYGRRQPMIARTRGRL